MPKLENFQAEDFLMDDHFIEWMLRPSSQTTLFWEDFRRKNPSRTDELEKAIQLFRALQQSNHYLNEQEAETIKRNIREQVHEQRNRGRAISFTPWLKVAAAIALVIVAGVSIYELRFSRSVLVETAYAVRQEIALPDASVVHLNGNSSLRYAADFDTQEVREVWLKGEAFFVVSKSPRKKFIVHTDDLEIEVLGTSFNVDNRETMTKVILNTGRIKVYVSAENGKEDIFLRPGEMIEYQRDKATIMKQVVNPESYNSWRNDTLQFNRVSVAEIAQTLEERYGYHITIVDTALREKYFTGRFPTRDIDIAITAMEKALGMEARYAGRKEMIWTLN